MTKEADTEMQYPKREPFFAQKFIRVLMKSCAAMEIGQRACLLLTYIATTEDSARYQGPVKFWNGQLMDLLGCTSPKQLNEARAAAIEAGWLHYTRDNLRKVGKYFVTIPASAGAFTDEPINPIHSHSGTQNGTNADDTEPIRSEFVPPEENKGDGYRKTKVTDSGTNSGKLSIPNPNPNPNPKERKNASDFDDITMEAEFIREWNSTPGVTKYRMNALPSNLSGIFRQRWEAHEDWMGDVRKALGMFPPIYYAGGSVQMKTFLQQFDTFADPNAWPHKPKGDGNEQPKRTFTQQREQNNADVLNWALAQCGGEEDGPEDS